MHKDILSAIAIALTIIAFWPYIRSIKNGSTKPHVFSWIIWGVTTVIVFLAQYAAKGGVGTYAIGVSGLITMYVALLSYQKRADISITRSDQVYFSLAILSLPFWYFTADPLWAVLILTTVDLLGFAPTFRKAYDHPFDEQLPFYYMMGVRNLIVILALEHYSLATVLFPAAVGFAAFGFIGMVHVRRR